MRKKTLKKAGAGPWKFTVGLKPHTVSAFERKDKAYAVWLRWNRPGTGFYEKMSLGMRLRDDVGRLDDQKVAAAQDAAKKAYNRLLRGEDPRTPEPQVDAAGREQLTIAEGLKIALAVPNGMYAVENDHVRDMRRYQRHLMIVLGQEATWDGLTEISYVQVWRNLARRKADDGIGGKRSCELAIVLLAQAGRWLKRAGKLMGSPAVPEDLYSAKLDADWHRITKEPTEKASPPRHTTEEVGRLFLNLDNPKADPRIRLAFRLAGEARLGQALACDRKTMDLGRVGAHSLGRFTILGNVKKKGVKIDLTAEQRAAVDYEMREGYLRELEAVFRAGHIDTYPLFPGKRLVRGVAALGSTQPIGDRAATDLWHEFERAADVAIIAGRGWYGVRRTGADLAEDVESDGRALNAITGHQSDEMRRKVYQDKDRDAVLAKATMAREAARQLAIAHAESAQTSASLTAPSRWEQVREDKKARRRAKHARVGAARRQATYPPKPCAKCGSDFKPSGPNSKACDKCSPRRVRPPKSSV